MTDKQIIIDGVDVSGCNRLNIFPMQYGEPHEICLTSLEQWGGQEKYCKDRPNCYYKQLKAKEQECEELKKQRTAYIKEAEENFEVHTTLKDNYRKLYQTLTEIKEIAEKNLNVHTCAFKGCGYDQITKQILQKISECEVK